jgi:pimeloyl-ACP methyl ester carboxylesterase
MQSVVSELLITYETNGQGKDILLLHGWGDDRRTFKILALELSKSYRVTTLDLPGFGTSEPPREVWGLDDYASFLKEFTQKLSIMPYAVIAHSNGGSVAIRALSRSSLSTEKLILLSSAGIRDREKIRRFLLKVVAKIGKILTFWLPERYKRKLQIKLYGAVGSDMNVVPHLQETFKKTVRIELPTLLIYGAEDKATPPLYGQIYAKLIKGSKLETIDGAGHFVHHDKSEEVFKLIRDFLSEN